MTFCAGALVSVSFALDIPVVNGGFEDPALTAGQFTYSNSGGVPGWSGTPRANGFQDFGVWHTGWAGKVGNQVGFLYWNYGLGQDLGVAVAADTVYEFGLLVNRNVSFSLEMYGGGTLSNGVVTGGVLLGSQYFAAAGSNSDLKPVSLVVTTPGSGAGIGDNLIIRIAADVTSGNYIVFDEAKVTAVPVPEPLTLSVMGLGALALAARRRRRA